MYKFNGFTEKANRALNMAIESAGEMGHTYVGSEHLLLGLLKNKDGAGYIVLEQCGASAERLERMIEEQIGFGEPTKLTPEDFTPRSKRVLQMALMKASGMSSKYVGTEHLLVALLSDSDCYAVRFLEEMDIRLTDIFTQLNNLLSSSDSDEETSAAEDERPRTGASGKGRSSTKTLDKYGRDLTEAARKGEIDPVIGRQSEIERVVQILSRRTKNNPCLIGEPGVGKTAVAEGLALKIVEGSVPELLKDKRIVALDLTSMVAGAKYRGDFEDRITSAIDEVKKAGNVILFIDELHTIIGSGSAEGSADAANILKPSLARGDFQVIGATTINEYRKYIEKDAALERRFQPVTVGEPSEDEAIEILKGLRDRYEAHHKVRISDESIRSAVQLSSRYIADRFLPDKAIDLIDEAASRVRLRTYTAPDDLKEVENRLKAIEQEKAEAVNAQDFETAARLRDEEKKLKEESENRRKAWQEKNAGKEGEVTPEDIAQIVSGWTGVPVAQLTQEESARLLNLEKTLHERIIGQDEAVSAVSRAIRRGRVGLKDPKRPVGSFIFLGPTGVGKTELCKALAQAMFGDENAIIRFDMSEFMEKHTVSKLIGSPPGYVGYDEGGQLTEAVRRHPYSVVLFDEIEKAHPDVFNMLLQLLDEGRLTDSQGRHVNFRNTVIIMTSNIGARLITEKQSSMGFFGGDESKQNDEEKLRETILEELKKVFKPEFLNRVDDTIVFHKLTTDDICKIAENLLRSLKERLGDMNIDAEFTKDAIQYIADAGYDDVYGARPLKRAIQTKIEDVISEKMLDGSVKAGQKLTCDAKDGKLTFTTHE